jgi:hypothetical protein
MIFGVSIYAFLIGYAVVLALELTRLYRRMAWRLPAIFGVTALALATHLIYLIERARLAHAADGRWTFPATLSDWVLIAAWIIACLYAYLLVRRPTNAIGPFLVPIVLAMVVASIAVHGSEPFDRSQAIGFWRFVHGGSLIVGLVAVALGFGFGLMTLFQEYQLKSKRRMSNHLKLPSLEYLATLGRLFLTLSTIAIAGGLISGIALNLERSGAVHWLEGGIVFSFGLLVWLLVASLLEWQASRRGTSWSSYLNIASFVIVVLALGLVFAKPHGRVSPEKTKATASNAR